MDRKLKMIIKPIHIKAANEFVNRFHRHNPMPKAGGKFAIAAYEEEELIGVAIGGRPSARKLDNGKTFEIYRVCTIDKFNATSFLLARMRRIAQQMGYQKFITHTLQTESGSSLRAVGGQIVAEVTHGRGKWNDSGGVIRHSHPVFAQLKFRWEL